MKLKKAEENVKKIAQMQKNGNPFPCPRCGHRMRKNLLHNALSRHADIYVCPACGMDEAIRDAAGKVLPLTQWAFVGTFEPCNEWTDIDLTAREPILDDNGGVNCTFEMYFDPNKKFGTQIVACGDQWVDLYATYYPAEDRLHVFYAVCSDDSSEEFDYEPTEAEKKLLIEQIARTCRREGFSTIEAFIAGDKGDGTGGAV